jgi:hypothetical protein
MEISKSKEKTDGSRQEPTAPSPKMEISKSKEKTGGSRQEPTAPSLKMEILKKAKWFQLPPANSSRQPTAESRQRERKKTKDSPAKPWSSALI